MGVEVGGGGSGSGSSSGGDGGGWMMRVKGFRGKGSQEMVSAAGDGEGTFLVFFWDFVS